MKRILFILLIFVVVPSTFWLGYTLGASNQKNLDAPLKAALITRIAELYEANDERAKTLLYTYLSTELSFYQNHQKYGIPFLANILHSEYVSSIDWQLTDIANFIHNTNPEDNKCKQEVSNQLTEMSCGKKLYT